MPVERVGTADAPACFELQLRPDIPCGMCTDEGGTAKVQRTRVVISWVCDVSVQKGSSVSSKRDGTATSESGGASFLVGAVTETVERDVAGVSERLDMP